MTRSDRRDSERRGGSWLRGWLWFCERRDGIERRNGYDRRARVATLPWLAF